MTFVSPPTPFAAASAAEHAIELDLQRYAALYELAPLAYFTLSREGQVLKTNRLGQARLRHALRGVAPQPFAGMLDEASLAIFDRFLQDIFARYDGNGAEDAEPWQRKTCELRLRPIAGHVGAVVELTGMAVAGQDRCNMAMIDVTERTAARLEIEQLNQTLEMRVAQLDATNTALEAYSSAVAHDLQTPLTALDGFRVLMEQAMQEDDVIQARHCTKRIGTLIAQMGETTSGLLSLARVSQGMLQWADCDLTQMGKEIVQSLRENEPQRGVVVDIESGLRARGDPALLRQLLANLLGNAWKFTSTTLEARIRLALDDAGHGSARQGCFMVTDNGAGFDMAHAARLFGAFERLHSPSEFPGSGIGLATVKRIVTRHGGHINAFGVRGEGARFSFSLPAQGQTYGPRR